jgi:DUF4097 and DUF4098 domain-containing protein YvlB
MRNRLAKLRRGEQVRSASAPEVARDGAAPDAPDVITRAETHRNVVQAVLALEEPYKSTLLLRFFDELSYDEIARRTGTTRATVNSRVTRGLEHLRRRLEGNYGGDRHALALALVPLARLAPGLVVPFLGVPPMHVVLATAAASLLAVGLSLGFREPRSGAFPAPTYATGEPARVEPERLVAPLVFPGEPERTELAPKQREPRQPQKIQEKEPWRAQLDHSLVLEPTIQSLGVNSNAGDVEVLASTSGRVEIEARVSAKLGEVRPAALTQVFSDHVDVRTEGAQLVIEDKHKNERGWSVDLVVHVPLALPLQANSGAGDVRVRSARGAVNVNSGAGDVEVELAGERLDSLNANSGAGDVALAVLSVEKKLGANSGAGAVTLLVTDASSPGAVHLNSGAGDVEVIVPPGIVGQFELETFSGELRIARGLALAIDRDITGKKRASGSIGSGGGSYRLSTGSGDVALSIGNALPARYIEVEEER